MSKNYYSLGLISGTSADGIDASIIQSDGHTQYKVISFSRDFTCFDNFFRSFELLILSLSLVKSR